MERRRLCRDVRMCELSGPYLYEVNMILWYWPNIRRRLNICFSRDLNLHKIIARIVGLLRAVELAICDYLMVDIKILFNQLCVLTLRIIIVEHNASNRKSIR